MRKKRKNRLKIFILAVLLPLIIISGIIYLFTIPLFDISTIEVEGLVYCNAEEAIDASGIKTGVNAFSNTGGDILHMLVLRYRKAEYNILKHCPYIKETIVRYIPPSSVRIQIRERTPVFMIPYIGKYLLIDTECVPVDAINSDLSAASHSLPILKGLIFEKYELGKPLSLQTGKIAFDTALNFMEAVVIADEEYFLKEGDKNRNAGLLSKMVTWIDVSDTKSISVLFDSRLTVNFGRLEDLRYRLEFLRALIEGDLRYGKGSLDFTTGVNPVFTPEY